MLDSSASAIAAIVIAMADGNVSLILVSPSAAFVHNQRPLL